MEILTCNIEDITGLHSNLFVEDRVVAAVAVMQTYGKSPCCLTVNCRNIETECLDETGHFLLCVSWRPKTDQKAERMKRSKQRYRLVELAAEGLALLLVALAIDRRPVEVTRVGEKGDYWLGHLDFMWFFRN